MKTIAQLEGVEFLRQCNKIWHEVSSVLENTKVMDIRKRLPKFTGEETPEQRKTLTEIQMKKNLSDMLDLMLEEKPEETIKLFNALVVLEEGEKAPSGIEMLMIGIEILSDKRVVDFLSSWMRLVDQDMGA